MVRASIYRHRPRGFTIIELVMVIAILGVIGAVVSVFMKSPIDAYFASARRAGLTDVADTTMRRMSRDARRALPNTIRTPSTAGANQCLEFIPTKTGGRYRSDGTAGSLDFASASGATSFNMLGRNSALPPDQQIVAGDLIAVYNLGISGADAYSQDNTSAVSAAPVESGVPIETVINIAAKKFPLESGSKRFQVISGVERVVSYVCSGNTLRRTVTAASFTSACPATGPIIANNVSSCFFDYNSSVDLARNAVVRIVLQIQDTSGDETVSLQQEIHVNNTP